MIKTTSNASIKKSTLVVCKIAKIKHLILSIIHLYFQERQENVGMKKQFMRTNWNGRIRRDLFKDKKFVLVHIVFYKMVAEHGKIF